jgi:hypothetical protein
MKMMRIPLLVLALGLAPLAPRPAAAQVQEALPVVGGALAGAVGGAYLAVSIIVLEARFGRFVHDMDDVLSWRSAPIVGGAVAGIGMAVYSPRRLESAVVYGVGGFAAGGAVGWLVGALLSSEPEGKWAGAAIGAGAGLVAGNLLGILEPLRDGERRRPSEGVPVMIRLRVP